jgi:hypothetical protein
MVYSGARGTLIYEKNLKSKFSCQTPFKDDVTVILILGVSFMNIEALKRARICRPFKEPRNRFSAW